MERGVLAAWCLWWFCDEEAVVNLVLLVKWIHGVNGDSSWMVWLSLDWCDLKWAEAD